MDLNDEIIAGYHVTRKTKELWAAELELLREFARVCDENGLTYYADSGTLIGAVRHKGFIPWDDDIDLAMLREDYDKLCMIAPTAFGKGYFFQNVYTDDIVRQHSQLRKNGTTMLIKSDYGKKHHKGIFIDIFVLDTLPCGDAELEKFARRLKRKYNALIPPEKKLGLGKPRVIVNAYNRLVLPLVKFAYDVRMKLGGGRQKIFAAFERECGKYNGRQGDIGGAALSATIGSRIVRCKAEWYAETVMLPFEDTEIPCPKGYDELLTAMYGDYMTFVIDKGLHGDIYARTDRDWREYDGLGRAEFDALFAADKTEETDKGR